MDVTRVLVATDGSAESRAAVEVGLDVAAAKGVDVVFVHADRAAAERLFRAEPRARDDQQALAAAAPALAEASALAGRAGVPCRLELVAAESSDEIVGEILATAQGAGADLVVVGSRGRGAIVTSVVGTVSRGIMRDAQIPAIVVKVPRR